METPHEIAAMARRFMLLADRPELLYPESGQRAERLLTDDTQHPLDVLLLGGVDETDRLCAATVKTLREGNDRPKALLDVMGTLPGNYLLGVYFALPLERRDVCERDIVWVHHISRQPEGIEEAMTDLVDLTRRELGIKPHEPLDGEEAEDFRDFSNELLRSVLGVASDA